MPLVMILWVASMVSRYMRLRVTFGAFLYSFLVDPLKPGRLAAGLGDRRVRLPIAPNEEDRRKNAIGGTKSAWFW